MWQLSWISNSDPAQHLTQIFSANSAFYGYWPINDLVILYVLVTLLPNPHTWHPHPWHPYPWLHPTITNPLMISSSWMSSFHFIHCTSAGGSESTWHVRRTVFPASSVRRRSAFDTICGGPANINNKIKLQQASGRKSWFLVIQFGVLMKWPRK